LIHRAIRPKDDKKPLAEGDKLYHPIGAALAVRKPRAGAQMNVAQILAVKGRDVVITQPHRTMAEAAHILNEQAIGAVVVVGAQGEVLGILSERDIVRALARGGADVLHHAVSRYMTHKVMTAGLEATIDDLMDQMTTGRFRHLPIVHQHKLVGLVSIGDVVKYRVAQIETEHRAMRDYIASA
jgi:CBS domain-containing protein